MLEIIDKETYDQRILWCLDLIAYSLTILEPYLQFATYFGAVELFSINTIYTGLTVVFVPFYHPKSH